MNFIFGRHFQIPYSVVHSTDIEKSADHFYINYSPEYITGFFNIIQHPLLLETGVRSQSVFVSREMHKEKTENFFEGGGYPVFFQATDHFDLKFDIFSCIFYLITRYEEYLPSDKDLHGRYISSNSVLAKSPFSFLPIVDIWLNELRQNIQTLNPSVNLKEYDFEYLPTIDVDHAFKYKGRNWLRHPANFLKKECFDVLRNEVRDPYDTVGDMVERLVNAGYSPLLFFLMSDDTGNDSNVSPNTEALQALVKSMKSFKVGIHPSYDSFDQRKIKDQKRLLETIYGPISCSRQHFLRIHFPEYFRQLLSVGIKKDFSLAYPDTPGFRAGYSRIFSFYDLEKDADTTLLMQPSCWMDATYKYYQIKNFEEICQEFSVFARQLKRINAKLVTIFHNDLFATEKFRSVFAYIHQFVNSGV
jgi:hypothetical protein